MAVERESPPPLADRLHAAVALAHWYIGQAGLKIRNGHLADALTTLDNVDRSVWVIGKELAPDLEPLPESLRQALVANGVDPDLPSVKSAESWSPPAAVDFNDPDQQAETEALVDETLKRMSADLRREADALIAGDEFDREATIQLLVQAADELQSLPANNRQDPPPQAPGLRREILDACCGGRMWWWNKAHPLAVYMDKREVPAGTCSNNRAWSCAPDIVGDFRTMPFADESFRLVVFDPPHIIREKPSGNVATQYGALQRDNEQDDLRQGFAECWRVLAHGGTLVFKWAGSLERVRPHFPAAPVVGTRSTSGPSVLGTHWVIFYKPLAADELREAVKCAERIWQTGMVSAETAMYRVREALRA